MGEPTFAVDMNSCKYTNLLIKNVIKGHPS